jgi:hypothetical protein
MKAGEAIFIANGGVAADGENLDGAWDNPGRAPIGGPVTRKQGLL